MARDDIARGGMSSLLADVAIRMVPVIAVSGLAIAASVAWRHWPVPPARPLIAPFVTIVEMAEPDPQWQMIIVHEHRGRGGR